MSVAFSSLSGWFKKSSKRRQAVTLKSRMICTSQPDKCFVPLRSISESTSGPSSQEKSHDTTEDLLLKEQNDYIVVNGENVDENVRIKLKINDTKWTMNAAEYQIPSGLNISSVSVDDEMEGLEEQIKTPRHNDKIDNQTMHFMQTEIKQLKFELTSMQTTIKDQGDKMKFLESQVNKNG